MYLIKIYKFLERKIGNNNNFNIPIKIIRVKKNSLQFYKTYFNGKFRKKDINIITPTLKANIDKKIQKQYELNKRHWKSIFSTC